MKSLALGAALRGPAVLFHPDRQGFYLNMLHYLFRQIGVDQLSPATRAAGIVMNPAGIDFLRRKGSSLVALMARLGALLARSERSGKYILQGGLSWRICFLELGA